MQLKLVLKLFLFITDGHERKSSLFVDYKILQIRLMFVSVATISNKKLLSFSKHNGKKVVRVFVHYKFIHCRYNVLTLQQIFCQEIFVDCKFFQII